MSVTVALWVKYHILTNAFNSQILAFYFLHGNGTKAVVTPHESV